MSTIETVCSYHNEKMWVSSDERKIISRIRKLKQEYPDEVDIIKEPQDNDGCIYATVPARWLRISPPRKVVTTEEQRMAMRERLRNMRKSRETSKN